MNAWDALHIETMSKQAYEVYGPYYQISDAEAETLVDVYGTAEVAAKALPHIPPAMLAERMRDIINIRVDEARQTA